MDRRSLENFVERFDDFSKWGGKKQVDYFAYFLTTETEAVFLQRGKFKIVLMYFLCSGMPERLRIFQKVQEVKTGAM